MPDTCQRLCPLVLQQPWEVANCGLAMQNNLPKMLLIGDSPTQGLESGWCPQLGRTKLEGMVAEGSWGWGSAGSDLRG